MQTKLEIQIIRCSRKTVAMKIDHPERLVVRVPEAMPDSEIDAVIKKHWEWITRHLQLAKAKEAKAASVKKFTRQEIEDLAEQALKMIPERAAFFAHIMDVRYSGITIRSQRTRWGSCSSKGNLNFNCLLMLVPKEVCDYVIVHELAHLKELNHSPRFWAEVQKVIPDFRKHRKWLKDNQAALIGRL